MKIKVLIADDHTIVRVGLTRLLSDEEGIVVVGEAKDGLETFNKTIDLLPDIVVMDLSMPPGESGLVTVKRIKEHAPAVKVIILTMHDEPEMVLNALENGANGYILKSSDDFDLVKAIEIVNSGEYYIYHKATTLLVDFYKNNERNNNAIQQLSAREQEILGYLAIGYSNKELAKMLYLSVKTLEAHQARIKDKIGVSTKPELVKYAIKKGLLNFQ